MINNHIQVKYIVAVVLALAVFRFVPHPPNATPIAAMALFSGAAFTNRALAYFVPIAAMIISDLIIGFHSTVWYVYAGIALTVFLGSKINKLSVVRVGLAAILASIIFFLITNFGAWLHHDMYPQNLNGLLQAYVAGLPFFRNSLIANLIFSYLVFYCFRGFLSMRTSFSST